MSRLYAGHASEEFNQRLDEMLRGLAADVQRALGQDLVALVLGGGYGRGEGGVVLVKGVEHPYNDMDFVVVVKRKSAAHTEALEAIGRRYEEEVKVRFEFGRPVTVRDIAQWYPRLAWYDLLNGHIVLCGPPDVIRANVSPEIGNPLLPVEASRLMVDRGGVLLWAMRVARGLEPLPDPDFMRRNFHKSLLAMGDAILILHQRFSSRYGDRDGRLRRLAEDVPAVAGLQLTDLYGIALEFKFRPDDVDDVPVDEAAMGRLAERWGDVFLYVEKVRIGGQWPSLKEYAQWGGLREPEQHRGLKKLLRNIVRNRQLGNWSWRYPRELLYRQLPVLFGLAGAPGSNWSADCARCLAIWKLLN